MSNLDEDIRIGEHAAALLQDEVLLGVFRTIREDCFTRWGRSGAEQSEVRENLYRYFKMAECVKAELERLRDAAKQARATAERENKAREFERDRGFRPPI